MNSIKNNFIYSCIYQIVNICIPLITTPYLSRVLGVEGVGVYSYSFSVAQLFVIFILMGLNNYGNRTIAAVRDSKEELSKTFWSIYCVQIVMGIIVTATYFIYSIGFTNNREAALILGLYVISACFDVNWLFWGIEKFKYISVRNVIIKVLSALAVFVYVKSAHDALKYCLIMGVGFVLTQFSLWPYVIRNIKPVRLTVKDVIKHIRPNCVLFITVIAVNVYKYMDKVMLGMLSTFNEVGYYELSEKVISVPTSFVVALGNVMLPRASYMVVKGDNKNNVLIEKSIIFAMFFSTSISFGIMAISKEFIPLFYGAGYDPCVNLFIAIIPSSIFIALANVIRTQYLVPHGLDRCYVMSSILGAVVNVIVNMLLIPCYGSLGAGIGTLFAEASVCIYQIIKIRNRVNVVRFVKSAVPYIIAGFVMFILIFNIEICYESVVIGLLIKVLLGIVVYFATLFIILKMTNRNIREVISLFSKE